ncbi:MAG: hypothetical protein M3M83_03630 [Thermoproteota archaeon]|jgi:hypothetical protein|nr:hypothetical protein [Thermoproteota archaeon]
MGKLRVNPTSQHLSSNNYLKIKPLDVASLKSTFIIPCHSHYEVSGLIEHRK